MYTVVIAEQEHLDGIEEYRAFLLPFLKNSSLKFCKWNTDGKTLEEIVPELESAVARNHEWRAVIICNEQGLKQQNPFNIVPYLKTDAADDSSGKKSVFELASEQPLTRLVTFLCESPTFEGGRNQYRTKDEEYDTYLKEFEYKEELRRKILDGHKISFSFPSEVICLAKRTCEEKEPGLDPAWTPHLEFDYSRFYDWNMYYDKMRYLVFDILPKSHQDYTFDYIRFLYLVLILATYGISEGGLNPNRVYKITCENNETALRQLVVSYDEKLKATEAKLEREITDLRMKQKPRLSDHDVEVMFCTEVTVPVSINAQFKTEDLYPDNKQIGLSTNCPVEEKYKWRAEYQRSKKTLHNYLKQPKRAIKQAVETLKPLSVVDLEKVPCLNSFQIEDVKEYLDKAELNMAQLSTSDFYDTERYYSQMEAASADVEKKIETRMTKRSTIVLGSIAMVLFLIGFLPLVFSEQQDIGLKTIAVVFILIVLGLLLAVSMVCLFFLRKALVDRIRGYHSVMDGIVHDVDDSLAGFSSYLGYAGDVMRGMSVLKHYRNHVDPDEKQIRVRKKHQMDIRRIRAEIDDIFGMYMTDRSVVDPNDVSTYLYNFEKEADYPYPMPYSKSDATTIRYMKPGNQITLPVDFVQSITTRLEELYDN